MNEVLTDRIIQYLQLETNYAVIIRGEYGIGKTYYFKHELFPIVKGIEVSSEKDSKFTPILISLFGIKTVEEIQKMIFLELYPILKGKKIKIASDIGKSLLKVYSGIDIDEYISNINTSPKDILNYNKLLLCFDDIDRKSEDLKSTELFGFINNLVENSNTKVIIIANEEILFKEEKNTNNQSYSMLREKVIGVSMNFKTDVEAIFNHIINNKYNNDHDLEYFEYLTENKNFILEIILLNKGNIRNLVFFLENFKIIYKGLVKELEEEKLLLSVKDIVFKTVLSFALPISVEYKMGKINSHSHKDISDLYSGSRFLIEAILAKNSTSNSVKKEQTYIDIYKTKYLGDNQFSNYFFKSIFDFIIGESQFFPKELLKELKTKFNIKEEKFSEAEDIVGKLSQRDFIDMEFKKYKELTLRMLKFVDKGSFALGRYPYLFVLATRMNNVLGFDIEKLSHRFIKGIDKGIPQYNYTENLGVYIKTTNEVKKIIEYCFNLNQKLKNDNFKTEISNLFHLFKTDFKEFLNQTYPLQSQYRYTPIFSLFNFDEFWEVFINLKNSEIIDFATEIENRYNEEISPDIMQEKQFVKKWIKKINHEKEKASELTKFALENILKKLNESLLNFN